jgi:MYXO-CTERM domain-containing protein
MKSLRLIRLFGVVAALLGAASLGPASGAALAQSVSDPNFVQEPRLVSAGGMTTFEFLPDGSILALEKRGRIIRFAPDGMGGFLAATTVLDLQASTYDFAESGLLGLALAPDYPTSRLAYVFQTTDTDQRVLELTLNAAGTAVTAQRTVVTLYYEAPIHKGGDIAFRPGEPDHLYIVLGDDVTPERVDDLDQYAGKILRIDVATGDGLATNPYYRAGIDALDSVRARIWAIGFRNPFRFTFHPVAGTPSDDPMYVSENGDSTDRLSRVIAGTDGAWGPGGDSAGFLSPPDPDFQVLETYPSIAPTGVIIVDTGPFAYRGEPVLYIGGWLGGLRRHRLTGADLDATSGIPGDLPGNVFGRDASPVDLRLGPDGALYYCTFDFGPPSSGNIGRFRWIGGDPPVAAFQSTPSPIEGRAPLEVTFTDESSDPDGTIDEYRWDFGDGTTSSEASPTHTYLDPGDYTVSLTVVDDSGLTATATEEVLALRPFLLELAGEVRDGREASGPRFTEDAVLSLFRSDGERPLTFFEGAGPDGNQLLIEGGVIDASVIVELTDEAIVAELAPAAGSLVPHRVGRAVDPEELDNLVDLRFVLAETAVRGRITDTRGETADVDLGVRRDGAPYALVNGRDFVAGGPAPTGVDHRVATDVLGYYHLPLRDTGTFTLDLVGDTGTELYIPYALEENVASGRTDRDRIVGLLDGGLECDDLSTVPETPEVDYASQIQPIWASQCIGCHRPNSDNGFGLNLTAEESYEDLLSIVSQEVPGRPLVVPFDPDSSFLMEKIRCADPQVGERMRPDSAMPLEEQALIRDWIAQGAAPSSGEVPDAGPAPTDAGPPPTPDAGMPALDAGSTPPPVVAAGGCAVRPQGASGLPLWLGGLLLVWGWRRRRR